VSSTSCAVENVILAGIGGQGSILAAHLLAEAAIREGHRVRLAETYGGAVRGGSVRACVRIGESWTAMIPEDSAAVVVSLEPLEALRVAVDCLMPGGWVLMNTRPSYPVDVTAGGLEYPSLDKIIEALQQLGGLVLSIDATELARLAGSDRAANSVMLGGLLALNKLEITEASLFCAMAERWPARTVDLNRRAFELGHQYVLQHKQEALSNGLETGS
jgi:indolepyruvate ferredoxin oxidoreductase, beta subunit